MGQRLLALDPDDATDAVRVERVSDLSGLQAHRAAWQALAAGAPAAQQPAFVETAWLSGLCAGQLRLLFAYRGSALVAVWPLHLSRAHGLAVVRHVGTGSLEEYASPLLATDADDAPVLRALWAAAGEGADLVEVCNVEEGSPAHLVFATAPANARLLSVKSSLRIRTGAGPWEAWLGARPKKFRDKLKYYRSRLALDGAVTFAQVSAGGAAEHAGRCIDLKRQWLDAHGIRKSWLRNRSVAPFFASLMGRQLGVEGFALAIDGKTVAGCLCLVDQRQMEFFLTAYDEAHARGAPGVLLIEAVARWCAERGLDFDFRFPVMPYKAHWADDERRVVTIVSAITTRGQIALAWAPVDAVLDRIRGALKTALTKGLKPAYLRVRMSRRS